MTDAVPYFHWADYMVFIASLGISLGIGIYYAIKDRNAQNNEEFLMAGRSMGIGPMTASMFATLVPSVGYIMFPVEVYYFGFGYLFNGIGACLGAMPIAMVIAPAFQRLRLVSAFQYLEERFNPSIRTMASILQILMLLFVLGAFTYAPAVAFAQGEHHRNMYNQELNRIKTVDELDCWAASRGLTEDNAVILRRLQLLADTLIGAHECSICGNRFKLRRDMLRHERQIHGEKNHRCDVCGVKFSRQSHLKRHRSTHDKNKGQSLDTASHKLKRSADDMIDEPAAKKLKSTDRCMLEEK